jgi:hypothetical protein
MLLLIAPAFIGTVDCAKAAPDKANPAIKQVTKIERDI